LIKSSVLVVEVYGRWYSEDNSETERIVFADKDSDLNLNIKYRALLTMWLLKYDRKERRNGNDWCEVEKVSNDEVSPFIRLTALCLLSPKTYNRTVTSNSGSLILLSID
jgi:hypothetical protein